MNNALNVLNSVCDMFFTFFQGYCLQYFYGSFLEARIKKRHLGGILAAVLFAALKEGISGVLPADYGSFKIVVRMMITFGIIILIAVCFYKTSKGITAFLSVTFMAVNEISFFLSYMILIAGGKLVDLYIWCMNSGLLILPGIMLNITWITIFLSQILMYIVFAMILYFSLKRIIRKFCEKDHAIRRTELLFLLTPGMTGLMLCVLLRIIIITVEDGTARLLYDRYPVLIFLIPFILVLSLMSIIYGTVLFQDMIRLNRERSSRIVLEKQVAGLQEHIGEMERLHSSIRGMKHDMKNTLSVIWQLAGEDGEAGKEELRRYLSELGEEMEQPELCFNTGNRVVDILLDAKYHEVRRDIPDIMIDTDDLLFADGLVIHSYDMGVIIGNALDNAIEACKKLKKGEQSQRPFIRMASFCKGKMLLIDIANSFDGRPIHRGGDGFPVTDKEDPDMHGMGLINIRNAVEKYHGAVDWSVDGKTFTLSIMMKNERREEDVY